MAASTSGQGAEAGLSGFGPEVVQSALAAGIPVEHLREMNAILKSKSCPLDELPRQRPAPKKRQGPLSESEDAEEVAEELEEGDHLGEAGTPDVGGGKKSDMEVATMKLTAIASKLSVAQDKQKLESLLDGGGGVAVGTESSGSTGTRKNAAAMRALQKCLLEDPKYLYSVMEAMEANVQSDFLSRPVQPGEPMCAGATIRGWLPQPREMVLASCRHMGCPDCGAGGGSTSSLRAPDCCSRPGQHRCQKLGGVKCRPAGGPTSISSVCPASDSRPLGIAARRDLRPQVGGDLLGAFAGGGFICGCQEEAGEWKRGGQKNSRQQQCRAKSKGEAEGQREGRSRQERPRKLRSGGRELEPCVMEPMNLPEGAGSGGIEADLHRSSRIHAPGSAASTVSGCGVLHI